MKRKHRTQIGIVMILLMIAMTVSSFGETLPAGGDTETPKAAEITAEGTGTGLEPTAPGDQGVMLNGSETMQEEPSATIQEEPTTTPTQPTQPAVKNISQSEALTIALKSAGLKKSQVKKLEIESENGKTFEIEFVKKNNRTEFSFEIAVKGGRILEKSVEHKYKKTKSKKKIGKKKARTKVAKASGKSYNEVAKGSCKYKYKKKQGKYEIKFRSGSYKYEYELLAPTGKIIEWEYEYIGTR